MVAAYTQRKLESFQEAGQGIKVTIFMWFDFSEAITVPRGLC